MVRFNVKELLFRRFSRRKLANVQMAGKFLGLCLSGHSSWGQPQARRSDWSFQKPGPEYTTPEAHLSRLQPLMCYNTISCRVHACGHKVPVGSTRVDCGSYTCRFSNSHPSVCPRCTRTCRQRMDADVRVTVGTNPKRCLGCL
ncbi:hypothetical protein C8R43DRAFT_99329 [Mycena crocata]|nr:hypothetical protein C8R43DRAFT_99329 [Mycena crocata]